MNTIFDGNYEGPLYAPHPDLIKIDDTKEDEKEMVDVRWELEKCQQVTRSSIPNSNDSWGNF